MDTLNNLRDWIQSQSKTDILVLINTALLIAVLLRVYRPVQILWIITAKVKALKSRIIQCLKERDEHYDAQKRSIETLGSLRDVLHKMKEEL